MASIGLPQESLHPSYLSIDLYATTLDLQVVSAQQSAGDNRPLLNCPQPEASAKKVNALEVSGYGAIDVPAMLGTGVRRVRRRRRKKYLQE